jgi:hypothetical protein
MQMTAGVDPQHVATASTSIEIGTALPDQLSITVSVQTAALFQGTSLATWSPTLPLTKGNSTMSSLVSWDVLMAAETDLSIVAQSVSDPTNPPGTLMVFSRNGTTIASVPLEGALADPALVGVAGRIFFRVWHGES